MSAPRSGLSRTGMRVAALGLGVVLGLALAELVARQLLPDPGEVLVGAIGRRIDDPVLGYRTAPGTGENDARGYRNATALETADVVALGDSQTWGVNVSREDAWPQQLARETGLRVYNMGRGGYGIVHYESQLETALSLEPAWIVVALYLGNDLYDAWELAYGRDAHEALRDPDPAARRRIQESAYPDLQRMFFERIRYGQNTGGALEGLARHSALVRLLQRVQRALAGTDDAAHDRAWARDHPEDGFVYDAGGISTVFHTSYRLAAVDTSLPRIREGLRITRQALVDIADRAAQDAPEARLLVVLVPTKERVFADAVRRTGTAAPASYRRSVAFEARIVADLVAVMDAHGIRHLDLLPALEAAVEGGEAIFPPNVDGHFTRQGYEIVARQVAGQIGAR